MKLKSFLSTSKTYIKKPWVIVVLAVLILVVFLTVRGSSTKAEEDVVVVKRGTVREEVSVTGKVKSAQAVNLSFEKSGRVTKVNKDVGEHVSAGEILVQIDNSELAAQFAQAQASLRYQQSKLSELRAGTRPEQLNITATKADSAKSDLSTARFSLLSALQNSYTSADDAIRNRVDQFFSNPRSANPQVLFTSTVSSPKSLETGRVEVEARLRDLQDTLASASTTTDIVPLFEKIKLNLGEIKLFLDNVSIVVNALEPTSYTPLSTLATWKADLSLARTNVNSAISNLLATLEKYNAANTAYKVAAGQLVLDQSGTVSQAVDAQEAQVAQAQANSSAVYAQLAKTYLRAPIDGIVTKQEAIIGETLQPNTVITAVMSEAVFEIEANIPEADIAKVKTGQVADVTLDAYSSDVVFHATVVSVDPAETIVDGVPTYKTTFQFENADERIKSGMTANIDIQGQSRDEVLYIPQRAVTSKNGKRYVTVKATDGSKKEVIVKTGLRGFDGSVEILEGVTLGDTVVMGQK